MLKLNQLYFRRFASLFLITFILLSFVLYYLLKAYQIDSYKLMLTNMIEEFDLKDRDISKRIKDIKQKTGVRVTIIDSEGVVLYESDRDIDGMENHSNREEIKEAREKGIGSSIRYSKSVGVDLVYVAKYQKNIFIRMSYSLKSLYHQFMNLWLKTVLLFLLIFLFAFFITIRVGKSISSDLKKIDRSLKDLMNKKYKFDFVGIGCCREFMTISNQIEKLAKKLEKREKQKSKYTKKLRELTQKQSDIISAISHEFKNPVAAITGYAQTIKDDKDISQQVREKFIDKVLKNANKINSMIDRLSMAIKLENDSSLPQFSEFRLDLMVEDIKENILQKYKQRDIILDLDSTTIYADRAMFENLIINLVENALKYSEDEVRIVCKDGLFEVIDQGIGIESKDIEEITKKFVRVDKLSWDNSIGVGLYLVKYILKLHNIDLQIESKVGKGSKFWFDLKAILKS